MLRSCVVVAALALPASAACTQTVASAPVEQPNLACKRPHAILTQSSAFHEAVVNWSKAPVGDGAARTALEHACAASVDDSRGVEAASCGLLGLIHASGEGVPRDMKLAELYLNRGAVCGFDFSAHDLAQDFWQAIKSFGAGCCAIRSCEAGCEQDCAKAAEHVRSQFEPAFAEACQRGLGTGCYMLARLAGRGELIDGVAPVHAQSSGPAGPLLERACTRGVGPACLHLAWHAPYEEREKETRPPLVEKACAAGWGGACRSIGIALDKAGERGAALPYWEKACAAGLSRACDDLGDILAEGDGVPVDRARAERAYAIGWRRTHPNDKQTP